MSQKTRRAVGVIRLSKMTEETTSPERQQEIITAKARERGAEIVGWARDDDVSATKFAPSKRPELAKWLARPDAFDEVIFWRADRFVRKVRDLVDMIDWSRKHGKGLVSATESFDLEDPTGQGEAMATMAALFAQMEAKATSIRVKGTHAYLRQTGRWPGGGIPYGYAVAANPDGPGVVLVPDPESSAIVREAVSRVIAGESVNAVAADFNRRGVLSPRDHVRLMKGKARKCSCDHEKHDGGCGKCDCGEYRERHAEWQRDSLKRILRSEALLGRVLHGKQPVPGDDGMPLTRADPLIDLGTFNKLKRAIDGAAKARTRTQTPSALLNVAFCGCGQPLYKWQKPNQQGRVFQYYRCALNYKRADDPARCNAGPVPCGVLDDLVHAELLRHIGGYKVMRVEVIPGDGHERELRAVGQQIADMTMERFVRGIIRPDYDRMLAALQSEHGRLSNLEATPDVVTKVSTGQTFREKFEAMTSQEQRLWLRDSGVKVRAMRGDWPGGPARPGAPLVAGEIPTVILLTPGDTSRGRLTELYVVIELGKLRDLLARAEAA
jgi:site-specific DNA recombinase